MLGWIVAIILYLLGGAATAMVQTDFSYCTDLGDIIICIVMSILWPFAVLYVLINLGWEIYSERKEEKELQKG